MGKRFKNKVNGRIRERSCKDREELSLQKLFMNNPKKTKSFDKKANFKCYKCSIKGHLGRECKNCKTYLNVMLNGMKTVSYQHAWIFDSGSTSHMCCDKNLFHEIKGHRERIELAANSEIYSEGMGQLYLKTNINVRLRDVLYVPILKYNFISVSKLADENLSVTF